MAANELRELSDEVLIHRILDSEHVLVGEHFQNKLGQLENTASLKDVRRSIARMRTLVREREIAQELKKDTLIHMHRPTYQYNALADDGGDQGGFLSGIVDKLSTSE